MPEKVDCHVVVLIGFVCLTIGALLPSYAGQSMIKSMHMSTASADETELIRTITTSAVLADRDTASKQQDDDQLPTVSSNETQRSPPSHWRVRNKRSRSRYAAFTIVKNEPMFLKMWLRHYAREFPLEDIYVINNGGNDTIPPEFTGANLLSRRCEKYFDHNCLVNIVETTLAALLADGYRYVVFAESDELLYVDGGLCNYLNAQRAPHINVFAFNMIHFPDDEPPIDWDQELVSQRTFVVRDGLYDKCLVNSRRTTFSVGFHLAKDARSSNPRNFVKRRNRYRDINLVMLHMQKIDYDYFIEKGEWKARQNLHGDVLNDLAGGYHKLSGSALAENYWLPVFRKPKSHTFAIQESVYALAKRQYASDYSRSCVTYDVTENVP